MIVDYLVIGAGIIGITIALELKKRFPEAKIRLLEKEADVGIRAQMFNTQKGKLEKDFLIEQGENSTHILNAISPAWTSAFPFARHVCDHRIP